MSTTNTNLKLTLYTFENLFNIDFSNNFVLCSVTLTLESQSDGPLSRLGELLQPMLNVATMHGHQNFCSGSEHGEIDEESSQP